MLSVTTNDGDMLFFGTSGCHIGWWSSRTKSRASSTLSIRHRWIVFVIVTWTAVHGGDWAFVRLFVWRTSRRWRRRKVRACTKFESNRCPNCNLSFNLWCLCVVMLVHDLNIPLCCFNFRKTVVNRVFNFGWVGTPVTNKVTEEMIWKAVPQFFEIPNSFV